MIKKRYKTLNWEYMADLLQQWSELLEVTSVSVHELHSWAREHRVEEEVLQKLAGWCEKKTS
jgi:hypothetical protein